MTSRDWQADRRAVFERDDHACRHCETANDDADPTDLRTYPVGAVPLEGAVHESALVTVCTDCFELVRSDSGGAAQGPTARDELFQLVRATTRLQGGAISDVASFASLATSLPTTLEEADAGTEPTADETAANYCDTRRGVLLALDIVDVRLERLAAVEETAFDADVHSSLAAVVETAGDLQSTLREVVALSETVPAGLDRCYGCFDELGGDACPTCGLEARETADWRSDDGRLAFERLFSAINDGLQEASGTTETLTDRTMMLAEQLTES